MDCKICPYYQYNRIYVVWNRPTSNKTTGNPTHRISINKNLYFVLPVHMQVTSRAFWANSSACLCFSSSSNNCFSMMRLASSTRRNTSLSISSFRFSSSSSTRLATSSSTRRAVSSSIRRSSISCCRLMKTRLKSAVSFSMIKLKRTKCQLWNDTNEQL